MNQCYWKSDQFLWRLNHNQASNKVSYSLREESEAPNKNYVTFYFINSINILLAFEISLLSFRIFMSFCVVTCKRVSCRPFYSVKAFSVLVKMPKCKMGFCNSNCCCNSLKKKTAAVTDLFHRNEIHSPFLHLNLII